MTISPKLNDCCVVLAAFSIGDNCPHATLPSSLNAVTAFLLGWGAALDVPSPVWVAYDREARSGRIADGRDRNGETRAIEVIVKNDAADNKEQFVVCVLRTHAEHELQPFPTEASSLVVECGEACMLVTRSKLAKRDSVRRRPWTPWPQLLPRWPLDDFVPPSRK